MPRATIFGCALLALGVGCRDPVERLKADLRAHLAAESSELALGDVRVLSRTESDAVVDARILRFVRGPTPEVSGRLLHIKKTSAGWRVERDLVKDFSQEVRRETFKNQLW